MKDVNLFIQQVEDIINLDLVGLRDTVIASNLKTLPFEEFYGFVS